ncbi:unnamed protein product [Prunus armeniaca]|uniref:Uncharacterized protein n=1 Tax=Prunus armeniaca TaxID=36596 RepID=A0A6J5X700_PRUAR|nr:unnamed protein product [Prunus armeniaca]
MERACSNDSQPNGLSKSLTFPRNRLNCINITAGVVVLSFFSAIKVISSSSLFLSFILSKWRKAKRLND